jgi:hypothetical protein
LDVFLSGLENVKESLVLCTVNEQLLPALVRFNFGRTAPVPRVVAADFSRDQKSLLADVLKMALQIPRELEDGRVYTGAELVNIEKALEILNLPYFKAREVAKGRERDPARGARAPSGSEARSP